MNKATFNKYHKEVYDKYGRLIKVGDTIVFPDGYYNDCHIGIVHHFTDINVIIQYRDPRWSGVYQAQRMSGRVIKIADGCSYPKLVALLDEYGTKLVKERNGNGV